LARRFGTLGSASRRSARAVRSSAGPTCKPARAYSRASGPDCARLDRPSVRLQTATPSVMVIF